MTPVRRVVDRGVAGAVRVAALAGLLCVVIGVRVIVAVEADAGDPATLVYGVLAPAAYLVPGVILLLRRRWHVVGWLLCAIAVGMAFSFGSDWGRLRFGGPWMQWALDMFEGSAFWLPFVALLAAFVGMVRRHRSSTAAARRQYRCVLSAIVFLLAAVLVGLAGSTVAGDDNGPWWLPVMAGYVLVPVAFTVAILRYRLYDIDRLITRTVSYSIVVALPAALYLAAVTLLSRVVPANSELAIRR